MHTARLSARFARLRAEHRRALIPYITSGFPEPAATPTLLAALAAAGADIIELGIPFSDPLADGPTIQRASQLALAAGGSLDQALLALAEFRRHDADTPVVLFSYLNPILARGTDGFLRDAVAAGADGVLLTDLPLDSDAELEGVLDASPLAHVRLIAPTTSRERARTIASRSQGFVYYISRAGVTGTQGMVREQLAREVEALRSVCALPIAVGFGISTPEQAATIARVADGIVVGSALVEAVAGEGVEGATRFLGGLRAALDAINR
ncbi:MAG: tryptophan synthase subunit alpha [Longimicrobiales bacterium]